MKWTKIIKTLIWVFLKTYTKYGIRIGFSIILYWKYEWFLSRWVCQLINTCIIICLNYFTCNLDKLQLQKQIGHTVFLKFTNYIHAWIFFYITYWLIPPNFKKFTDTFIIALQLCFHHCRIIFDNVHLFLVKNFIPVIWVIKQWSSVILSYISI